MPLQFNTTQIKDLAITSGKLAGSIPDSKLSTIATANKVSGSAIQLNGTSLEDDSGLKIKDLGVTNDMLAGSIANAKLANSAITIGGATTSLGGAVTSATILAAGILNNVGAATSAYSLNSQKITNLADPTSAQDAATKAYVDANSQGLDVKESCLVATTANITLSGTQTIDGVAVTADKRVLVKDQSNKVENGIYLCKGDSWTRATDFAAGSAEAGAFTFVEKGTVSADAGFVCTADAGSDIVGTNNLDFTQFSGAGQVTAGDGIDKLGNTLSADLLANGGIRFSSGEMGLDLSGSAIIGSLPDARLATITSANKVSGSAVQLKASGGLEDSTGLQINLDGTTLALGADGIKVNLITNAQVDADAGITDGKLATIATANKVSGSAVQLAANTALEDSTGLRLKAATAGDGLAISASQVMSVNVDDSSIEINSDSLRVKGAGIATAMLADDAVTLDKIGITARNQVETISGSATTTITLTNRVTNNNFHNSYGVQVFKNGQRMIEDASGSDNAFYEVSDNGSTTRIIAKGAFDDGDIVNIIYASA